jgi:hypothetical protein
MRDSKKKTSPLHGLSFALLFFAVASSFEICFMTVGGIFSLLEVKKILIPSHFKFFDWLPAVFLFFSGVGLAVQSKNKGLSIRKLKLNAQRKGALILVLGVFFSSVWSMNIFIILGASMIIGSWFLRLENVSIFVIALLIIVLSLVLINFNVPFRFKYFAFNAQDDGLVKLIAFIGFNGYFSILPWSSFFIAGMAVGKTSLRPRGFFPPSSIIAILTIALGAFINVYCEGLYREIYGITYKFLYPFDQFVYQPAFVLINIGIGWLILNFLIHLFDKIGERKWMQDLSALSTARFTYLFLNYMLCSVFLWGFAFSGTIIIGFAYPVLSVLFILLGGLFSLWVINVWQRKIHKNAPLEWLMRYISIKENSEV